MKLVLAALAFIFIASLSLESQTPPANDDSKVIQEMHALVRAWDDAFVKGDTATLDRLLADDFAFVGGLKKTDYLTSFKTRAADAVESAVSTDIQVQVYGNTAVLTALDTISGKNKGQAYVSKWLYMDVWIKRGGRWQCVKTYSARARD
jgi:ketosteroid isomerase-like protein